jgi:rsbT co-antagonist protein RsbR
VSDQPEQQPISSALSQMLLDAAPDAIVAINRDGYIVFANRQVEQTFGWETPELVGEHIEKLIPERFRDRHRIHRSGYFAYPRIRPMGLGLDLRGLRKDTTEFPVEISLSPVEGDLAIATVRDMSARHRVFQEQSPNVRRLPFYAQAVMLAFVIATFIAVLVRT